MTTVKRGVYQKFQNFFEDTLKWKTWVGIQNYYNTKDEWPTTQELADFLDESRDNIQPRTSELNESMAIEKHEKRPCKSENTSHNISVTTWKMPNHFLDSDPCAESTSSDEIIEPGTADSEDVIFG